MIYTEEKLKEALMAFRSKEKNRPKLSQPFINGDYVCASNGHIGLLIPKERFTNTDFASIEGPPDLLGIATFGGGLYSLTAEKFELVKVEVENKCDCDTCDGTGECTCSNCDEEHKCGVCRGKGYIKTSGTHEIISPEHCVLFEPFLDTCFNQEYVHTIFSFFLETFKITFVRPTHPLKLEFEDIIILLMPMRVEDKQISVIIKAVHL